MSGSPTLQRGDPTSDDKYYKTAFRFAKFDCVNVFELGLSVNMILLLVSVVAVLLLLASWIKLVRESKRFNINGPSPLPLIGNAHLFIVKSSEFLNLIHRLSLKYGDAFRVHMFSQPTVILNHPKYIEELITSTDHITKGVQYNFLLSWLGQGLLTSTGQKWKSHRKFLTPAFHFNILQNFLPVFCKNQRVLTEKLKQMADGRNIDMFPLVALAALDNVTESIMGLCIDAQQHSKSDYVQSVDELSRIVTMRMQIPILGEEAIFNLLPLKTKQDKALKVLHGQTNQVINARRQELKKLNITTLKASDDVGIRNKHAFLDLLLLSEIDGQKINDQSVREEVDTFMFEGHDTTTSGIAYTLYLLSKHRDVQEKIFEELKTIFTDDLHRDPTYNEFSQMKYLELVLKESMRLFPPVPLIARLITRDCEIGGLKLVKGTSVLMNIFQIHRHPEIFEDPLEFRPERFEGPLKHAFAWVAFSAGPRNCIGQKFAMMELKITISEIIKNFIILPSDQTPELSADLVLRSQNGVNVKLRPRH
ncbi:cytochrome P450 4d2-like [Trichoplusia ni]|uniref:Cytochrome P450 4d2-like n=1 Tax=Trichoplusia ni TaxID=7111 RepID=A0A7E5X031_TRINI|nr:cytochrome P450 4d2-like [Trichoplusia ni]